jgi:predicted nucleic acid-binding protein
MKRILVDTNVVLDVLLDREPHVGASAQVWAAVERNLAEGLLSAHAVTTIHYLVRKEQGNTKAKRTISAILRVFDVAMVDGRVIREALQLSSPDFEDAVTAAAALLSACDLIVTRDPKGFRGSVIPALTPEAVLPILSASHETTRPTARKGVTEP